MMALALRCRMAGWKDQSLQVRTSARPPSWEEIGWSGCHDVGRGGLEKPWARHSFATGECALSGTCCNNSHHLGFRLLGLMEPWVHLEMGMTFSCQMVASKETENDNLVHWIHSPVLEKGSQIWGHGSQVQSDNQVLLADSVQAHVHSW